MKNKTYSRKQIKESIRRWKQVLEAKSDAQMRFQAFLNSLPKDEKDFLTTGTFEGKNGKTGLGFRLTAELTMSRDWAQTIKDLGFEAYTHLGDNGERDIYGVFFLKKGEESRFQSAFASLCRSDKELFYGLKYGTYGFTDLTNSENEYMEEFAFPSDLSYAFDENDIPSVERSRNDPTKTAYMVGAICRDYNDDGPIETFDPLGLKICKLAGITPLSQHEIDDLVELGRDVEIEELHNYDEERQFKWDMFFAKLGIQKEGTDLIRKVRDQGVCFADVLPTDNQSADLYDYMKDPKAKNVSKIRDNINKYKQCLNIVVTEISPSETNNTLDQGTINRCYGLVNKIKTKFGHFPWLIVDAIEGVRYDRKCITIYMFIFADNFPERYFYT